VNQGRQASTSNDLEYLRTEEGEDGAPTEKERKASRTRGDSFGVTCPAKGGRIVRGGSCRLNRRR